MSTLYRVRIAHKIIHNSAGTALGWGLYATNDFGPLEITRRSIHLDERAAEEALPGFGNLVTFAATVAADKAVQSYIAQNGRWPIVWNEETCIETTVSLWDMPEPGPKVSKPKATKSRGARAFLNLGR